MGLTIREGNYLTMGAIACGSAVCFTFEADKTVSSFILLYNKADKKQTERVEVSQNFCIGALRSIWIEGIDMANTVYLYEIDGQKTLDPYARRIVGREKWNDAERFGDNLEVYGGFVCNDSILAGDSFPEIPKQDMVMYKLHVRGFSMDYGKAGKAKGTFGAIKDRILYLKSLGITTIEAMPLYEFEERYFSKDQSISRQIWEGSKDDIVKPLEQPSVPSKIHYWGYTKGQYFAPKEGYAQKDADVELKELIAELHKNNMELIMEVFFVDEEPGLVIDMLRHWVADYHVDGFHLLGEHLPIVNITSDVMLKRTKIFYHSFPQEIADKQEKYPHLYVYNDEFLYPTRRLLNSMEGRISDFACQMRRQDKYCGFVNYVASNNGFTLADVFAYCEKHNEANGEHNLDGCDWNYSTNYGVEGASKKNAVVKARRLRFRAAIASVLLSQSVPLIYSGDECLNSQDGNNNAYCRDDKIGWVNWSSSAAVKEYTEFVRRLAEFRKSHPVLRQANPVQMADYKRHGLPDLSYHCEYPWMDDLAPHRQSVGMLYCGEYADDDTLFICYNFRTGAQQMALPTLPKGQEWSIVMCTADDQPFYDTSKTVSGNMFQAPGTSVTILIAEKK